MDPGTPTESVTEQLDSSGGTSTIVINAAPTNAASLAANGCSPSVKL
jgi:hypothetical protein